MPHPARLATLSLLLGLPCLGPLTACKKSPAANPEFGDAAQYLLRVFDTGTDAERAYGIRQLEEQTYLNIDLEAGSAANRSVTPAQISSQDIADLNHPDVDLAGNVPVAVGVLSA
ncbi:MAG: hypothetical protein GXP62_12460, partial [Oligoflexia bacterium]|nr:hypothetical protein [Oligoflexia bacterium]